VEDRITEILEMLDRRSPLAFRDLFVRLTRLEIMVTFLAMLELIKAAAISARQDERFGEILIFKI
jgi:segregation and condensation protein A